MGHQINWGWPKIFDGAIGIGIALVCLRFAIGHFFFPDQTRDRYYASGSRPELYTRPKIKLLGVFFFLGAAAALAIGAIKIGVLNSRP